MGVESYENQIVIVTATKPTEQNHYAFNGAGQRRTGLLTVGTAGTSTFLGVGGRVFEQCQLGGGGGCGCQ